MSLVDLPDGVTIDDVLARTMEQLAPERVEQLTRTIAQNPRSTIEPSALRSDALGRVAIADLGDVGAERVTSGLALETTLGEGGMGIVRLATQRSLGRKVAVKTLRPEVRSEQATLRLLREAWVTGALEHPNIVPVYDLGLDASGAPIIVLKRIEGVAWSTLVSDSDATRARFGVQDVLEHNLRILVQLCHAVSLAHARGIVHRDLKPENVMIGSFGEVYLVDWGIAVSIREDPTGRLPRASAHTDVAGTPCYMAPEMLGTTATGVSERTDVYLLGAILHELLTGRPPHDGRDFRAIVVSILTSEPSYGDDVPRELAAIAMKALRRDPEERFASADELRARLEWYLRHRTSLALSDEAAQRLGELRASTAAAANAVGMRDRIYRLVAEARFGFRQALVASDDNDAARAGLRETVEHVVEWELAHGTAEAAAAALAELRDPPSGLADRVAAALEAHRERAERLDALERAFDPSVGRRTRLFVSSVLGLSWMMFPWVAGWAEGRLGGYTSRQMYLGTILLIVFTGALSYWARDSLSKSAINRRAIAAARLTFAAQLLLQVAATLTGMPVVTAFTLHFFVWFMGASAFATFVEPRLWPAAIGYAVGTVVVATTPGIRWAAASATHAVLLVNVAIAWNAKGEWAGVRELWRSRRR